MDGGIQVVVCVVRDNRDLTYTCLRHLPMVILDDDLLPLSSRPWNPVGRDLKPPMSLPVPYIRKPAMGAPFHGHDAVVPPGPAQNHRHPINRYPVAANPCHLGPTSVPVRPTFGSWNVEFPDPRAVSAPPVSAKRAGRSSQIEYPEPDSFLLHLYKQKRAIAIQAVSAKLEPFGEMVFLYSSEEVEKVEALAMEGRIAPVSVRDIIDRAGRVADVEVISASAAASPWCNQCYIAHYSIVLPMLAKLPEPHDARCICEKCRDTKSKLPKKKKNRKKKKGQGAHGQEAASQNVTNQKYEPVPGPYRAVVNNVSKAKPDEGPSRGVVNNVSKAKPDEGPSRAVVNDVSKAKPDEGPSRAVVNNASNGKPGKGIFCVMCRANGETGDHYGSHTLRGSNGNITCPILRAHVCPICKATGDNAHTLNYCPENKMAKGRNHQIRRSATGILKFSRY